MSLVIDASVAMTWCFADERTAATLDGHLRRAATAVGVSLLGVAP